MTKARELAIDVLEDIKNNKLKFSKRDWFKKNIKEALSQLSKINQKIIANNKFPLIFGGEHSITPGSINPFVNKYSDITLLHFDANADLRES